MASGKRLKPSARVGELPDGTIIRAPLRQGEWFYAQKWKDVMILYRWAGVEDLAIEEIVSLPVVNVVPGGTSLFWLTFWKPRPEVVGCIEPNVSQIQPFVRADLIGRQLVTWTANEGYEQRPASFGEMDGVATLRGYQLEEIVEQVVCAVEGRPWTGETIVDGSRLFVNQRGHTAVRPEVLAAEGVRAPSEPDLYDFAPDLPEWVDEVASAPASEAISMVERGLKVPGSDEYFERDDAGVAILAAALVRLALEPKASAEVDADDRMLAAAKKLRKLVTADHRLHAVRALDRVLGESSELGAEFAKHDAAGRAFVEAIRSKLASA